MHELDGLGVREPLEQQECQQRFCESWLLASWESGLAALSVSIPLWLLCGHPLLSSQAMQDRNPVWEDKAPGTTLSLSCWPWWCEHYLVFILFFLILFRPS